MKIKTVALSLISCAILSSCYCDKVAVGNINAQEPLVHVQSVRNNHFLCGLFVQHHTVKSAIGDTKDYVIENKRTFWDGFVSGVTFGIYTPTTTKYYVPKSNPSVVVEKQKFKSKASKGYLK